MAENTTIQALSEVYSIINHLDKNLYKKIPNNFIKMIENNRDLKYDVNIDYTKNINEQNLLQETRVILSLIYRDYLCTKEEREKIILEDQKELEENEQILREKYKIDFNKRNTEKNKKEINYEEISKTQELVEMRPKAWYEKLIEKILKVFRRKSLEKYK